MIIILIISFIVMLSMKEAKNTKKLTCYVNGEFYGMESKTTLESSVKNNEIKKMKISIDVIIPVQYESEKQNLINSIRSQGKMDVVSTKDGIKLKTGMNSEYFKTLGLSKTTSYGELREALEAQGYDCE